MKLALLFALVAAAAILSESAPIKAIPDADEAFLESMLDSLKPSAPQLTEDVEVGNVCCPPKIMRSCFASPAPFSFVLGLR